MEHRFQIGTRWVGDDEPTYFIAEMGSNFDGSLERARGLVDAAHESGADAVKFQTFTAEGLVSSHSFARLKIGYQAAWDEPTHVVYKRAEFPRDWHEKIFEHARRRGVAFFTSVWDHDAVDLLERLHIPAYKIGSGDITWFDFIRRVAQTGKPVLISTGASSLRDVARAIDVIRDTGNQRVVLMQCVTNYPSTHRNANLLVLETYRQAFDVVVGYSDHAPGDVVALGAVALGARVIEKHFTLDKTLPGPDHPHSMEPHEFAAMVQRVRALEAALGSAVKQVTDEERDSTVIMRRSLHAARAIATGEELTAEKMVALRPAVGIAPEHEPLVIGRRAVRPLEPEEAIRWEDLA